VALNATNLTTGVIATTATAAGVYLANITGLKKIRARVTWSSGTSVTVVSQLTQGDAESLLSGIAAGENVIGKVAGSAIVLTPTWTVDTAVYAAGDSIGGKITLTSAVRVSGGTSLLYHIHIMDRSNQKPTGNILIFNADPSAATITDNAAFVYSTDDFKEVARIPVTAGDYVTINSKASADLPNLGRQVKPASGLNLYAVFVTDGAPDFVATTDFQIIFKLLPVD
jgi:hypothetical protein